MKLHFLVEILKNFSYSLLLLMFLKNFYFLISGLLFKLLRPLVDLFGQTLFLLHFYFFQFLFKKFSLLFPFLFLFFFNFRSSLINFHSFLIGFSYRLLMFFFSLFEVLSQFFFSNNELFVFFVYSSLSG